jgi:hypothetical protein
MLTPTPSRPGRSRKRRWLSGAVTLLAALAAVVGLAGLQAPGASASVARAAAAGHPALAAHSSAGHAAAAPKSHAKLKPVVRTALRHDTSPKMRNVRPDKNLKTHKLKTLPLRSPPHSVSGATSRTADVQRSKTVTTDALPSFGQNFEGVSNLNGVFPPDTNMAVGPNDIVQTVNFSFAVYNKSSCWRREISVPTATSGRAGTKRPGWPGRRLTRPSRSSAARPCRARPTPIPASSASTSAVARGRASSAR